MPERSVAIEDAKDLPTAGQFGNATVVLPYRPSIVAFVAFGVDYTNPPVLQQGLAHTPSKVGGTHMKFSNGIRCFRVPVKQVPCRKSSH
mmetsp:Transcript_66698/g.139231  ORF Transcript_66698/g.139231 Transcript_66698/m.139231 type:complete len:89 (-) Transcript_66698:315-581(-)